MEQVEKDVLTENQLKMDNILSANHVEFNNLLSALSQNKLVPSASLFDLRVDPRYDSKETMQHNAQRLRDKLMISLKKNCFEKFCNALRNAEVGLEDLAQVLETALVAKQEASTPTSNSPVSSQWEQVPYQKMLTKHHSFLATQFSNNQSVFNAILDHMLSEEVLPSRTHTTLRITGRDSQPDIEDKVDKFLKFLNKPDQSRVFDVFDASLKKEGLSTVSDRLRK